VVGSDKGSPRVRFLGSGGVKVVRRMADDSRGGLRPCCGSMSATCRAGARDRSTGCRRGEVGVEEHEGDRFNGLLDKLGGGGLQHPTVLSFVRPCTATCGKLRRGKGELVKGRDGRGNSRGSLSPPFYPVSWHRGEPHGRGADGAGRGRRVLHE
jgi:hypothetical protein